MLELRSVLSGRARTRLGAACVLVSLAFIVLWFVGQEASQDPTLDPPRILALLYPGTWHPIARGVLWLFVGSTAVGFDLLFMYPRAETRAGRFWTGFAGVLTGVSFLAFSIASFANAPWTVIH